MTASTRYVPLNDLDGNKYGAWFIDTFNDAGAPANSNNSLITFQKLIGGVPNGPIQTIRFAGISKKIDEGLMQTGTGPFKSYVATTATAVPDDSPASPPVIPDTNITAVNVTQKADSNGANGKVTIIATSSFLPLVYYIDDVLQSGIQPYTATSGDHIAKVIDVNGNIATKPFTVTKVTSILTKDPTVTTGGFVSRWNSAFNPIVFEFNRKDFAVTNIIQDNTTLKPRIYVNSDLTKVVIGDYIYLEAGIKDAKTAYKGTYQVLKNMGDNSLVIDTTNLSGLTSVTGFTNINALRPYYKISIIITTVDLETGQFKDITGTYRPNGMGITRAEISSYMQSVLSASGYGSDYTQVNYRDNQLSASYQIKYAEVWEGNTPEYITISQPFYVVFAAKQVQQVNSGNLFEFVTQQGGQQLAKWITDFNEPAYTTGLPFDLSFIYSEKVAGRQLYYELIALDVNRNPIGITALNGFLLNENNSYILNQDTSKFIIAEQNLINTPISERIGLNRLLINQDFGQRAWYFNAQLFYNDNTTQVPVTQSLTVRIDRTCQTKVVYVRWIGLTGSWNYFRFNYNQTKTLDIQNPVITKGYVFDYENSQGADEVVSKEASAKLQVFADALTQSDIDGLQSLKYSPKVQMLTSKTPLKWQTIIVNSGTFTEYETQVDQYEFSVTFNLPGINVQTQ